MKATLRRIAVCTIFCALFVTPVHADESIIWLDNFWSDGSVRVFCMNSRLPEDMPTAASV